MAQRQSANMKFPRDKNQYVLIAAANGTPDGGATMYKAKHVNPATGEEIPVGIKIFNTYKIEDIYSFTTELHEAETWDHENIIKVHCSFKINDQLWIIMSPPGFSIRSMIWSSFPHGLPENAVSFILKETLKALHYMHEKNMLHENIGAGCIFLDEKSRVKLAYSSLTYEDHHPSASNGVLANWTMATKIMIHYTTGNNKATDIWMFGLLALELFYGQIPADEFQLLGIGIDNEFVILKKKENHKGTVGSRVLGKLGFSSCFHKQRKKIPEPLGEVIAACLSRDPEKRPTTNQLMEYNLFQECFPGDQSLAKLMKKACKYGSVYLSL